MRTPRSGTMGAAVALVTLLLTGGTDARSPAVDPIGTAVPEGRDHPVTPEEPEEPDRATPGTAEMTRAKPGAPAPGQAQSQSVGSAEVGSAEAMREDPDARADAEAREGPEGGRQEAALESADARPHPDARGDEGARPNEGVRSNEEARVTSSDDDSRRRYRRRYRNRYPGPIPTPADWRPPDGPVRIALQAGHWRADEAPDELSGLRDNGTRWEGIAEWEANLEIARRAGAMLEDLGYVVDILPAVVPPGYRAHLFVSIHADGSGDPKASGYRVAYPSRDATGRASGIASLLEKSYGETTGLRRLPDTTRRMRNYYAFNFRRYEHALHPMTIAVIIETGFLTSDRDRGVIVDDPDRAARGIVAAITEFPVTPAPAPDSAEPGS